MGATSTKDSHGEQGSFPFCSSSCGVDCHDRNLENARRRDRDEALSGMMYRNVTLAGAQEEDERIKPFEGLPHKHVSFSAHGPKAPAAETPYSFMPAPAARAAVESALHTPQLPPRVPPLPTELAQAQRAPARQETLSTPRSTGSITPRSYQGAVQENGKVGVGAYFQKCSFDPKALEVRALLAGSPAEGSGMIKPKDIILEVDGIDVYGMGVGDLIPLLLGEPGSQVSISLASPGAFAHAPPASASALALAGQPEGSYHVALHRRSAAPAHPARGGGRQWHEGTVSFGGGGFEIF